MRGLFTVLMMRNSIIWEKNGGANNEEDAVWSVYRAGGKICDYKL